MSLDCLALLQLKVPNYQMKKLPIIIAIFTTLLVITSFSEPVYAQCGGLSFPGSTVVFGPVSDCTKRFDTPAGILSIFLPSVLGILGFITVIMIVISGIQFISSSGNPEAAGAARGRLTYAIIGFIIIVLAYAILQIVNRLFLNTSLTS